MQLFRPLLLRYSLCAFWISITAVTQAQTPLLIQFFLPGGELPSRKITFYLTRDDGTIQTLATDDTGKFTLQVLEGGEATYRIRVESDRGTYSFTIAKFHFRPGLRYTPVFLSPLQSESLQTSKQKIDDSAYDEKTPVEARLAYDQAMKAVNEGKIEEAINEFTRALSIHPKYPSALNKLGMLYFYHNRPEQAEGAFTQAISLGSRAAHARVNLGTLLHRQGRFGEAVDLLSGLVNEDPTFTIARITLADALTRIQQWDEAAQQIRVAISEAKLDRNLLAEALIINSRILYHEERYKAAITVAERAIATTPEAPRIAQAYLMKGSALVGLKRMDEAEKALLKAYELGGRSLARAQLMLGELYYAQQKYEPAQRAFEQYLADVPNAPNAIEVRESIEKAKAAVRQE